ncbi:SET and MYND domain-containing protein [Ooceraea biroi]|uniref:SET and MYND domain-containing protein n=1 Tax=Ooceraea biroi TaxID=2015173 RepID=A0A026WXY1_OOCBI|nr:SET and MYND domain-containing protein [Ooceraea biroi]
MLQSSELDKEMKNMKHENELMSRLFSDRKVVKSVSLWLEDCHNKRQTGGGKNVEKSESLKNSGNKEFQTKNYIASLKSYTKSALYAPADSKNLPIAVANRSASLFYLKRWQDCIKDVKLALELDYPKDLRHKLYLRMAQCYSELGEKQLATEALLQASNVINECDMPGERKDQLRKQMDEIKLKVSRTKNNADSVGTGESSSRPTVAFGENSNFSSASAGIEVKYASQKGRHINKLDVLDKICHNCCRSCGNTPVPCTGCIDVTFCDMNCWNEASSYHRWECPGSQMDLWAQIGIAHLALKILFMCVITIDSEQFNEVQKLVSNFDEIAPTDVISYGITAAMLALYLSECTNFFKDIDLKESLRSKFSKDTFNGNYELTTRDDERLYLISNGHAITKINVITDNERDQFCTQQQDRIATAIYPSASLMNHSCDPNILNSFIGHLLIVKAIKDIAAGEEVFHCYGTDFRRMSKAERQERLKSQYCFTCACEPCTMPRYENFMERFLALKCPECRGPLPDNHNSPACCFDCGAIATINHAPEKLGEAQSDFLRAEIAVENEKYDVALTHLKKCLSIRQDVLYKYHNDIAVTWDFIAKVYVMMGRWSDSILCLEHSVAVIEERYGPSGIELCNEMNKLTDLCVKYLQQEFWNLT